MLIEVFRMKHLLILLAVVCTIAMMYATLSSITKDPATVVPCKNADCEDGTKHDVYIPEREQILRGRARTLRGRCEQLYGMQGDDGTTAREDRDNYLLVSDKFKLVFCYIPKVACANVRRTFLLLNGIVNKTNLVDITNDEVNGNERKQKRLTSYSKDGIRYRLQNYTKVMFVRDPFERLISAFNEKFKTGKQAYFKNVVTHRIIQALQLDKVHAGNITFANFIHYLIIENGKHKAFDEHWDTYSRMCDPCRIQYDYIGAYETIDEDMGAVLKEIGADFIHFPTRKNSPLYRSTTASADLIEAFYKDIPDSHIKRLKEIYANDMLLFGLKVPKAVSRLEEGH